MTQQINPTPTTPLQIITHPLNQNPSLKIIYYPHNPHKASIYTNKHPLYNYKHWLADIKLKNNTITIYYPHNDNPQQQIDIAHPNALDQLNTHINNLNQP